MVLEVDALSLTEIIRLQEQLSSTLRRRFERDAAIGFSDIVGSTAYFSKFGNEAGQQLQQRHNDFLLQVIPASGGRIVDTAGDGALLSFPSVQIACHSFIQLQQIILQDNHLRIRDQHLLVRAGIHWGTVLTDDIIVAGEAVNVCAHLTQTSEKGEIRLTKSTFLELTPESRLLCRPLPRTQLKGLSEPVELFLLEWSESEVLPDTVEIQETGYSFQLPDQDRITFGRLGSRDGVSANDIVLELPDPLLTQKISRWHFELLREREGILFHLTTSQPTEVNGNPISKGGQVPIHHGTLVNLSGILTLRFLAKSINHWQSEKTTPIKPLKSLPSRST